MKQKRPRRGSSELYYPSVNELIPYDPSRCPGRGSSPGQQLKDRPDEIDVDPTHLFESKRPPYELIFT